MIPRKKLTILLLSLLTIVILIGVFESSTIINIIAPPATPQPTITQSNVTMPAYTPTPDAYTGMVEGLKVHDDNYNDSYGLTASQKMDAILLVTDNSTISEKIKEYENMGANISIGPVTLSNQSIRSGYLNLPNLVNVPMQFGDWPVPQYFIVYIDEQNRTVIGMERWWPKEVGSVDTPIPAGAYWYHRLMGPWINSSDDMSRLEMRFRVAYSPEDARIYPIVVDESNFYKFKNCSSFSALRYVDYMTNQTTVIDGTKPILPDFTDNGTSYWMPYMGLGDVQLPDYWNETHPSYYVIFKNGDSRAVQISGLMLGP
jgi:hypothetical protein